MSKYLGFVKFNRGTQFVFMLILGLAAGLTTMPVLAAEEAPRQIVNAHTLFNVGLIAVFLHLTGLFARLDEWIAPDKPLEDDLAFLSPIYLDEELLDTPSLALERARYEIGHMGEYVNQMLSANMPALLAGDRECIKNIAEINDKVNYLYAEIIAYLGKVSGQQLTDAQVRELSNLLSAVNDLERIGDIIESAAVDLAEPWLANDVHISEATQQVLDTITGSVEQVLHSITQNDSELAQDVMNLKDSVQAQVKAAELHQAQRMVAAATHCIAAYSVEMEVIERLKRIYYFAKRMAKTVDTEPLEIGPQPA